MKQSNFKIIAIKALKECNSDFTKILEKEKLYYFYSDLKIDLQKGIETLIPNATVQPEDLYQINTGEGKININISAIVGKNGSGKSSIIELLFRAINNIACNFIYEKNNVTKTIKADLKLIEGLHVEFYYQSDKIYKVIVKNSIFEVYSFNSKNQINKTKLSKHNLSKMFYTEAVNYSHYAYNSLEFGYFKKDVFIDWLKELFHKNDSYQTPLVLNPMRTEGNFDINRENDLVKQRLLSNILRPVENENIDFRKFGENLYSYEMTFKLKDKKLAVPHWTRDSKGENIERFYNLSIFEKEDRKSIIKRLMLDLMNTKNFEFNNIENESYKNAEFYIIYKLVSICKKYPDYNDYLLPKNQKFNPKLFDDFVKKLKEDTSHITYKLRQTLNFIKHDYINYENVEKTMSIENLSLSIKAIRKKGQSILALLPPPIFEIELGLKSIIDGKIIKFSSLSSGEKQQIYMVSSLLYHLNNLDSVVGNKIKYQNINIVLEEVELYFHPELQKSFIKYFLDSIGRIELKNIKSINICFVTHSPFILSDIPSNNIMFLEVINGKAIQKTGNRKTFGANIHEFLTDSFFMSTGFIGDFAKNKIDKTIDWLNEELIKKRRLEKEKKIESYKYDEEKFKFHKGIISLIDEPILRIKLSEMLSEIDENDDFHDDLINEQIKSLESRLKKKEKNNMQNTQ